jgi:hypothetical protein
MACAVSHTQLIDTALLLCGYRRTGKDTVCNRIQDGTFNSLGYAVFRDPTTPKWNPIKESIRIAFADILKNEVCGLLNVTTSQIEPYKDVPLKKASSEIKDLKVLPGIDMNQSYRDLLIEYAMIKRKHDPDYWCKAATNSLTGKCNIIITDFRFPNEAKFMTSQARQVFTARIFRSEVPIPIEPMEHMLDGEAGRTDYLICRPSDFEVAKRNPAMQWCKDFVLDT